MVGELPKGRSRTFDVLLHRTGERVDVERPDSPAENKLGKVSDGDRSYSPVGTFTAKRVYPSFEQRPRDSGALGGRVTTDEPRLAFSKDADVQEDDRVTFDDDEVYNVDKKVAREAYDMYRVTRVT